MRVMFFASTPCRASRSTLFPYTTLFRSLGGEQFHVANDVRDTRFVLGRGRFGEVRQERENGQSNQETHKSKLRDRSRSEEHTSELQSPCNLVCRLLLEKKKQSNNTRGAI